MFLSAEYLQRLAQAAKPPKLVRYILFAHYFEILIFLTILGLPNIVEERREILQISGACRGHWISLQPRLLGEEETEKESPRKRKENRARKDLGPGTTHAGTVTVICMVNSTFALEINNSEFLRKENLNKKIAQPF
jgi:hypothetical protein